MSDDAQLTGNELAKAYDPSAIEEKWARYWVAEKLFDAPAGVAGVKTFSMLLPPPNVTGRLHMGHMLNQAEMDILTRWHRMLGETALWVPGTDHAGIATQMMVEKQLAAEGTTTRQELGRETFIARVWEWKRQYGGAITEQMRRLGASVDWSREYFTMNDDLSVAVNEAFVRLYEQGLIYRGAYIVNWDPALQSAVSDLEVESEERVGKLYSIRYLLADGTGSIVVATTRPETLLGDVAVAVNPADARYAAMVGKRVLLPLTGREIPIVADDWANPEFGTGAVKVTPAHDPNDFAIGQRHSLPSITVLDKAARIALPAEAVGDNAEGVAAKARYEGLDRFAARTLIVEDLQAQGLLVEVKEHPMTVPVSQRSGSVIEPRLSDQWFIKIQPLADKAIAAVREGHIKFTPEMYAKTYFEWMGNIHDWCISRQLWWGHRIPAWFCESCGEFAVARVAPTACVRCGGTTLRQETDVLDTWFSSGLLPFTVFGWPGGEETKTEADSSAALRNDNKKTDTATADMAAFYPTDLLVTGFDILFFWVARMVMLGTHFMLDVPMPDGTARTLADAVPFREVYIHGLVRDADKQKMSKTKGNVLDPIGVIERFGTDAVRFTLASMASPGTDIAFSEERTDGYRAFANKIWNAARFLLMNVERGRAAGYGVTLASGSPTHHEGAVMNEARTLFVEETKAALPLETRWIVSRLSAVAAEVERALALFRFDEAAHAVYRFFWGEFCDWYLELAKVRLDFAAPGIITTQVTLDALLQVYEAALRLLSPFMPFITEEIWHGLYAATWDTVPAKSIALTRYPLADDFAADAEADAAMATLQEMMVAIRAVRKELGVPEKESTPVRVFAASVATASLATENADMLARMARVSAVEIVATGLTGAGVRSAPGFDVQVVYERVIDVPAERERLTKDLAKYEKGLAAAEKQLGNEGFMARAPAHIVEGLRKQESETRAMYEKTRAGLQELSKLGE